MKKIKIVIVNEKDKIIDYKDRDSLERNDIYRVSALWIVNNKGEYLLARRGFTKSHHPGKWGPAVAGTVDKEETYLDNIVKEAEEELGLSGINFKKGPKTKTTGKYNHFTQWYIAKIDKEINDFRIKKDEVAEIKWFSREELLEGLNIRRDDFIPSLPKRFQDLILDLDKLG